ncbi:MAG: thymidine kinase [Bacteroidales bacterium]|nr:thymidine kinase [Bacteroidales bacterium]
MFTESAKNTGRIEVICGSMFSGKTEELIRRMRRAVFANLKTAIFKPAIDVRYSDCDVVALDAKALRSTPVKSASEILDKAGDAKVIGIDEAQFFDGGIVDVVQALADRGVRVIIAGLDMDYLGKPFGPMPALMAVAEDVLKVHAICVRCGDLAQYSHRLSKSDKLVELGEKDIYEPICRACYNRLKEEGTL